MAGAQDKGTIEVASHVVTHRSGMAITATWTAPATPPADAAMTRAAGAYAASLRLARLPQSAAAALAEREGLVTHLTSLILVDEQGAVQPGIPATRKVALPSPATFAPSQAGMIVRCAAAHDFTVALSAGRVMSLAPTAQHAPDAGRVKRSISPYDAEGRTRALERLKAKRVADAALAALDDASDAAEATQMKSLARLVRLIDWRNEGQRLSEGNMIALASEVADAIDGAANYGAVRRLAKRLGLAPRVLVIALLARAASPHDRHADRVARAILAKAKTKDVAPLAARLGL
jgi:hypothetical protein